jgi:HAD superfamily hydrolase (TIGR01509 family)
MTRRALVFDVGGVLVQWRPLELMRAHFGALAADEAGAKAVMAQVFQTLSPEADWGAFDRGHIEPDALADRIAARTGYPLVSVQALIGAIPQHLQPMSDSVALLERVRAAGHGLGLLSNMPKGYAAHLERSHACFSWFEHRSWSGRLGVMKPQREIFDHTRDAMGLDVSQALFIDDHLGNVHAARALGWQALHFHSAEQCAADLAAQGWL